MGLNVSKWLSTAPDGVVATWPVPIRLQSYQEGPPCITFDVIEGSGIMPVTEARLSVEFAKA